ncbi:MAG: hypothetical protein JXR83_07600 [Deltaproteobacteria bacterium]|nr:hypothetical protein [Deltaproteobacteria bacterium]
MSTRFLLVCALGGLAVLSIARCSTELDLGSALQPEPAGAGELRACNDGLDNDGDLLVDYPNDPGCESPLDPAEEDPLVARACSDGADNDGDGRIDFDYNRNGLRDSIDDPGCDSAADDDESNVPLPECADGFDNDSDGRVDLEDLNCSGRNDDSEAPECGNGLDDDSDGAIDFPDDLECDNRGDDTESE